MKQQLNKENNIVLKSVHSIMSDSAESISANYKTDYSSKLSDFSIPIINQKLIRPVREIADRGGKGWRSYIMLSINKALKGDSKQIEPWIGIIELLHVGSLMIDDIEDNSSLRRGGKTSHLIHGLPIALNSGCHAYFMLDRFIENIDIPAVTKLKMYKVFFQIMRAAHAGQCMDINGLDSVVDSVIKENNFRELPNYIAEIHRLKTGLPLVLCLLLGAYSANADDKTIEALTLFGESVGIGFQIGDDAVNLKGFNGNLKIKGEDIHNGKITFPVALATQYLSKQEAAELLRLVALKKNDNEHIRKVMSLINKVNAIEKSLNYAKQKIKLAWKKLERELPDTKEKSNLLDFSLLLVTKHY